MTRTQSSRAWTSADGVASSLLAGASFLLMMPGAFWQLPPGKGAMGALRVLAGEVPYRDFWTVYAPGHFYLGALLLDLFGRRVLVLGIATVLMRALCVALLFRILRRLGLGTGLAVFWAALFAAASFEVGIDIASYPPALLLILAAWDRALAWIDRGGRSTANVFARPFLQPFVVGLLLGCAAGMKHDVAAYAMFATAGGMLVARAAQRELFALFCGAALPVLAVAAWLASAAGRDAWTDLIAFPLGDFRRVWEVDYPGLLPPWDPLSAWLASWSNLRLARNAADGLSVWLSSNLPFIGFAVCAIALIAARSSIQSPRARAALGMALLGLPLFFLAARVQRNTHVFSMAILCALGLAAISANLQSRILARACILLGLLQTMALLIPAAMNAYSLLDASRRSFPPGRALDFPLVEGIRLPRDNFETLDAIGRFVREHTLPQEPIHVGLKRHDAVVIGNQRIYLAADRPSATRYNELHGGVTDRVEVQREMIEDIERQGVRCMVLWNFGGNDPDWSQQQLDRIKQRRRERLGDTGSELLDDYIREHYDVVLAVDEYEVVRRRELSEVR